jgi:DNA-binding MarR family transcriptional regulator
MQDDRLRRSLGYTLLRAFRNANRETARALQPYDVSAEQAHILLVLWLEGPMRVGELQQLLALSSGTMTGALDRMRATGLVRRVDDPDDGRAFRIEAAPMEPRRKKAIEDTLAKIERDVFASLSAAERTELLRLLKKAGG